ncbi:MAG: hypothetical protein MJY68_04525 [Bacteroidaceae bacterium]|nr:hypothetical protein [Bacteroidaceae bacterium]
MKRNIFCVLFAACLVSASVVSCDPMEPATYTENFFRIASVKCVDGKASLVFDYTRENFNISNFKTESDLQDFKLKNGDRIIAQLQLYAVGNMANNKLTLLDATRFPIDKLDESKPADTLNHDYRFNMLTLIDTQYPNVWSQGHLVNVAPVYYVPESDCKAEFHLYPLDVRRDTLIMRLYSYIPENDLSLRGFASPVQSLLCYDISSLRDSVADADENNHRKNLLNKLTALNRDTIMVRICQPDTLCGMLDTIYYERYVKASVSTSIPFDF